MPVRGYEHTTPKRGPKNVLLGVMPVQLLMWQRTDKDGLVHTELGVEIKPGDIRKLPQDLWNKSGPVNDKLQKMLAEQLHGKKAVRAGTEPAKPSPREKVVSQLPLELDV